MSIFGMLNDSCGLTRDARFWSLPARHWLRFMRWQAGILDEKRFFLDLSGIEHRVSSICSPQAI
jgi:hypothetical protein